MTHKTLTLFTGVLTLSLAALHGQQMEHSDRDFLRKAAQGGMHEVQFGKLGLERASSQAVKEYARRLVNDHARANKEIVALAKRKGIMIEDSANGDHGRGHGSTDSESAAIAKGGSKTSTGPGRQASSPESDSQPKRDHGNKAYSFHGADELMAKSGSDFDAAYIRMAIADHQKDIAEFEKVANSAVDNDVKALAAKTLPTLRAHLKAAQSLQKQ